MKASENLLRQQLEVSGGLKLDQPMVHTRHTFGPSQATGPGLTEVDVVLANKAEWNAWAGKADRQWSVYDKGAYVVAVALAL